MYITWSPEYLFQFWRYDVWNQHFPVVRLALRSRKTTTLLKMSNSSWDPASFYLGWIPYRIGTQHPNSRRDSSFLGKRCREQKYFFDTKMKIRKNYIVGIFSKSLLELGQIPIRNGIYLRELDPNSRGDVRCISALIGINPTNFLTVLCNECQKV